MLNVLIRHGQCITNLDRSYSVSSNDEDILTADGCSQSLKTARFIKSFEIEKLKIAASTLARAKQSAQIIFEELGLTEHIYYSDLLIEKSRDESYADAYQRYNSFIKEFGSDDDLTLLVITHGHLLQAIFAALLGLNNPGILDFHNCGISTYESNRILTLNSYFHLKH